MSAHLHLTNLKKQNKNKQNKREIQEKCLPDELFDETKDGRGDGLRIALYEIERTLIERVASGLVICERHAVDQTRR